MDTSADIDKLATALAKAQGQIQGAVKDSENPHFKAKYADLASVWEACRKPLADNGLSIVQGLGECGSGRLAVTTRLMHASGQWITSTLDIPLGKADAHGVGSAATYARRYALSAMVGVAPEDDDGAGATDTKRNGVDNSAPVNRFVDPPSHDPVNDGPVPREKLEGGPYTSKTALQAALRTYALKMGECTTSAGMIELQTGYAATLEQARRYLPAWLDGDENNPDSRGLIALAIDRKALIDLLEGMKETDTAAAQDAWGKVHGDDIDGLSDEHRRIFEAEYEKHGSGLLLVATASA